MSEDIHRRARDEDVVTIDVESDGSTPGEVAPADTAQLNPGAALGRYLVVQELGAGGMGRVVRAYDPRLRREVALKLLRTTDEDAEARIVREAQAMARLSHPHVVAVYDVERDEGRVFIAMEYVPGTTLGRWLKQAPRGWRKVLAAFVQAGRGLAAAHAAGLVHRDFKPANVLVGQDGRVRVTDFGLVRGEIPPGSDTAEEAGVGPTTRDPTLTVRGTIMGTPPYMAPEQHRGEPVDARGDQFAFCVALYQGLFGVRPFDARDPGALRSQKELAPRVMPPSTDVPIWVRRAVLRGLSARPADRFPSMNTLLDALERRGRTDRRRRIAVGSALLTAAIAAGVAGLALAREVRPPATAPGSARAARVRVVDPVGLLAAVELQVGRDHARHGDREAATRRLEDAYYRATAVEDDRVALDAAIELVAHGRIDQVEQRLGWARQARALLARPGHADPERHAALEHALGLLHTDAGDPDRARDHFDAATLLQ